jgi:hypothetical protein
MRVEFFSSLVVSQIAMVRYLNILIRSGSRHNECNMPRRQLAISLYEVYMLYVLVA